MNNDWLSFFMKEKVSYVSHNDKEKNLTNSGMCSGNYSQTGIMNKLHCQS